MQLKKFSQLTPGAAAAIEEHPRLMGLWDLVWPWVSETNAAVSYCSCAPVVLKGLLFPCSDFDGKGMSGCFFAAHISVSCEIQKLFASYYVTTH